MKRLEQIEIGQVALNFWRWWSRELVELVPVNVRNRMGGAAHSIIRLEKNRVRIDRVIAGSGESFADERALEALDDEAWEELRTLTEQTRCTVLLQHPDIYTTSVKLPRIARRHLVSAVELQLDEISPLQPHLIRWVTHDPRIEGDKVVARVTMAKLARLKGISETFLTKGWNAVRIEGDVGDRTVPLHHARAEEEEPKLVRRHAWIVAGLLLASVPVSTILTAATLTVIHEQQAEEARDIARPKLAAQRQYRRLATVREGMAAVYGHPPIMQRLNYLAAALPASGFVRAIDQRPDGTLELLIDTSNAPEVSGALKATDILPGLQLVSAEPIDDTRTVLRFGARVR